MRIYVASSWKNQYQPALVETLRLVHHQVYDFRNPSPGNEGFAWRSCTKTRPPWTAAELSEVLEHRNAKKGFGLDMAGLKWCDVCILLLPCGRSAHLEAGFIAGSGKPVLVYARPEERFEPELMYLTFGARGALFDDQIKLLARLDQLKMFKARQAAAPAAKKPAKKKKAAR